MLPGDPRVRSAEFPCCLKWASALSFQSGSIAHERSFGKVQFFCGATVNVTVPPGANRVIAGLTLKSLQEVLSGFDCLPLSSPGTPEFCDCVDVVTIRIVDASRRNTTPCLRTRVSF